MKTLTATAISILLAGPVLAGGHATGDPAEGENSFKKCKSCHMIESDAGESIVKGGKTGPNLWGIFARVPGTVDGFKYGDDLQAAGAALPDGWIEEEFVTYVADPTAWLKDKTGDSSAKSRMSFKLKDAEEAANIWAYLVSVGPQS